MSFPLNPSTSLHSTRRPPHLQCAAQSYTLARTWNGNGIRNRRAMPRIDLETLTAFLARILEAAGAPHEDALIVADHLGRSDLAGHPSHGTVRVPQYVEMVREGTIVPGGAFQVVRETATTAVTTGGWNFGQVGCARALELAMGKAREAGLAAVTLRESAHVGRLGAYAERAAPRG